MKLHPQRLEKAHEEHERIFDAIRSGDFREAEEQARIHVDRARSAVLSHTSGYFGIYEDTTNATRASQQR
jgi:DNA-binding GntR family transcriptional regulator